MVKIAIVDINKCKPNKCNNECKNVCPVNSQGKKCIEIVEIENLENNESSKTKAKIASALCIGCGLCERKCPFKAIETFNLPAELATSKLLYSYGENSFRIYNYPSIKRGSCVGFLGANSLGKSTIFKIMTGEIKVDKKMFVVGDEMKKYMSSLNDDDMIISYKPQEINQFKNSTITVKDYIVNTDLINSKYIELFQLTHLFDRQLKHLSDGEMQRLLIAKTCAKNANAYFFDEPSAFLDIKQRIIASNLIKEVCTDFTYLICVEHDLCVLDYICDNIVCLYGEKTAYGVISSIYGTKTGINCYLDGYLKNENMQFRNTPVTFNKFLVEKIEGKEIPIYKYDNMKIEYKNEIDDILFCLDIKGGEINAGEIVLLIGENGMGKTSFIKQISKDTTMISSVKKQDPYIKYNGTVENYLERHINDKLADSRFKLEIINALGIDKLYDLQVNTLSGGQAQKLSIVTCLGRDANLFLLDEPSAFIDVEDRCKIAKIIKQFACNYKKPVFIIEHDITMATNISDKVIVFEGQPGIKCSASEPCDLTTGINKFLKNINVTMRKDKTTGRPGINKPKSKKDIEQQNSGYYYIME